MVWDQINFDLTERWGNIWVLKSRLGDWIEVQRNSYFIDKIKINARILL